MDDLTKGDIKRLLDYDQETGVFRWREDSRSVKRGDVAGTVYRSGYRYIRIGRVARGAHRIAFLWMEGAWPAQQVDHINGARDDNRWENLRQVDMQGNNRNRRVFSNSTSGILGVVWHKRDRRWQASITLNNKRLHLGCYKDFFDACCARKAAENDLGFHPGHGRAPKSKCAA